MSIQTCKWEMTKNAACSSDFGLSLAARWFGYSESGIEVSCGRFARGKNKGKVRGWIVWRKCSIGGWCFPLHCVIRPGMIFAHFCSTYDEMCNLMNLDTERFMAGATRVDTQYGHELAHLQLDRHIRDWKVCAELEAQRTLVDRSFPTGLAYDMVTKQPVYL